MKIQYKFLIIFLVAFAITIVPNLLLFNSEVISWLPVSLWTLLSIARFILLLGLFFVATHYWIVKPLKKITFALSLNDPLLVEPMIHSGDEIGKIALLLKKFLHQQTELEKVMKEKSKALESAALSEAKLQSLLNAVQDMLFRVSLSGVITDYHVADEKDLFLPPDRFLGKRVDQVLPKHVVADYYQAILDLGGTSKSKSFEYALHMADGSERFYEAMVSATEMDDYLVSVRNITLRKEAELSIAQTLHQQQELNEMKSRFISLVSHEFRTPVTAISSNVQLLTRYEEKWPHDKKAEVLHRIQEAIKKMITLLDEVSLISKDQNGVLLIYPETICIHEFVPEVIDEFRKNTGIDVHLELTVGPGQEYIDSDKELLRQILSHLLSNAGKFSPQEKPVRVTITRKNNHIGLMVTDQGIGIPDKDLEHLFQPFHRGGNSDDYPGTGLGMSIVKRCVDLLNGTIRVISRENEGTAFDVKIPVKSTKATNNEQNPDHRG